jgi:cupin 2 domain-containing protein|tara:strand:+ start:33322 stop:33642 length:321 start_codon:yes stop_codon:yes gene_type:complete
MKKENLLSNIPAEIPGEVIEEILSSVHVRIERIVSKGHDSLGNNWYDQDESEWVLVLQGAGALEFEGGEQLALAAGDYVNIPAHKKHRVAWTDPDAETIWLAVFYQ